MTQELISSILTSTPIEGVVGTYLTLRPASRNSKKDAKDSQVRMTGICPFCASKQPTLQVDTKRGFFSCSNCHRLGNAAHFLLGMERLTYERALQVLADDSSIPVADESAEQAERQRLWAANQFARQWFEDQLWNTEEGQTVGLSYLHDVRHLTDETIRAYHIGYAPDSWDALAKDAQVAGFNAADLKTVGLCSLSKKNSMVDLYRNRVMFVGHDVAGHVISFAGRAIRKEDAKEKKYVNSPESPIFTKKNEFFGIYEAIPAMKEQGFVYLVEGQIDLISMHQMGIHNVVASGGTSNVSTQNVRLLHRFVDEVVVLFDSDSAGMHGAVHATQLFLYEGMRVKALLLPEGHDPDSFSHTVSAEDYRKYFHTHVVDYVTYIYQRMYAALREAGDKTDAQMRAVIVHELARTIALRDFSAQRASGIRRASELLEISERDIMSEVNRNREAQRAREAQRKSAEEFRLRLENQGMQELASLMQNDDFQEAERNLIRLLASYAEVPMPVTEETPEGTTVLSYVSNLLDQDQLTFHNPTYQQIYDLLKANAGQPDFCSEQFLKYNSDPEICYQAIELLEDPYQVSRLFFRQSISENVEFEVRIPTDRDRLGNLAPRLVTELQIIHVRSWISSTLARMKHPSPNDSMDQMQEELASYNQLLSSLNDRLGRVMA